MRDYLEATDVAVATSRVAAIEITRAIRRYGLSLDLQIAALLVNVAYVEMTPEIVRSASWLMSAELRTLDAIHLASALGLGGELDSFVTYDSRLAGAARSHGLPVASPT